MTKYFDTKNGTLENAVLSVYEKKLDPVNKDAVKKKFDDRKDKDIDNDGDVDSTDKFLHKRRKAITKAVEKEGNMFTMKLKKARDNGENGSKIVKEMMDTGDYDMLVQTFLFYFGDYVNLVNSHGDNLNERYING